MFLLCNYYYSFLLLLLLIITKYILARDRQKEREIRLAACRKLADTCGGTWEKENARLWLCKIAHARHMASSVSLFHLHSMLIARTYISQQLITSCFARCPLYYWIKILTLHDLVEPFPLLIHDTETIMSGPIFSTLDLFFHLFKCMFVSEILLKQFINKWF